MTLDEIADGVERLATDESLAGRLLICWPYPGPQLVTWVTAAMQRSREPTCRPRSASENRIYDHAALAGERTATGAYHVGVSTAYLGLHGFRYWDFA